MTDAQRRALEKYSSKSDTMKIRFPKEEGKAIRLRASELGLSLVGYLIKCSRLERGESPEAPES